MVVPKYLNSATLPVPISILFLWPSNPHHSEAASLLEVPRYPSLSLCLSLTHTHTHTNTHPIDSSGRVIVPSQRPPPTHTSLSLSLTHTHTHTHTTRRLFWTSDRPVPEAVTYNSHTHTHRRLLWTSDRPVPEAFTYTPLSVTHTKNTGSIYDCTVNDVITSYMHTITISSHQRYSRMIKGAHPLRSNK